MPYSQAQLLKNRHALALFDRERMEKILEIEYKAIAKFQGTFDELEAALGVLHLGDHMGWKPLVLIHNKRTIRKYEEILGIRLKDLFPEEGPSASRSIGYTIAKKIGSFWKAVSGEVKDDDLKAHRRSMG